MLQVFLRATLVLLLGLGAVIFLKTVLAEPRIACGSVYTVEPGDTLYDIAKWTYGDPLMYQEIYGANRDMLRNERTVKIGEKILIPCLDGAQAEIPGDALALEPVTEIEDRLAASVGSIGDDRTTSQLADRRIRFLTGSDFTSFSGKNLHVGGIINDLVTRTMSAAAPEQGFRISLINDWSSHLDVLLPDGAFDVSFPWYKPDCAKAGKLSEELRLRCSEFEFSNPFYEVTIGFYTRAGDRLVETMSHGDLFGKRLCRPKGHFMFDLDQHNLKGPNVSVETPNTATDCFNRLMQGQVDVVSLVKFGAEGEIRQLGISDRVAEINGLASRQTLHALVLKSNPNGRAYLDIINQGLASLMASGEWFTVVAAHQRPLLAKTN